ncbi:hypothetical protein Tco_0822423 [Tanacetum coccineum]|uniref:Reverse transcriptase domain-containing protein n=1 Tax=Tanacetum coccineum TaxID=301880 RepID=A0ABQ5AJW8_9ASTR
MLRLKPQKPENIKNEDVGGMLVENAKIQSQLGPEKSGTRSCGWELYASWQELVVVGKILATLLWQFATVIMQSPQSKYSYTFQVSTRFPRFEEAILDGLIINADIAIGWRGCLQTRASKRTKQGSQYISCIQLENGYATTDLAIPLDGLHFDDKLQFVEEPVEIVDREVKWLKRSRILLIKVR